MFTMLTDSSLAVSLLFRLTEDFEIACLSELIVDVSLCQILE